MDKSIETLIPHRGKMRLLDKVVAVDTNEAITQVEIRSDSLFLTDKGVPALVGIEYMAQTIAAYSGKINQGKGLAPQVGFLLGSRHYHSDVDYFLLGDVLKITAKPYYMDEGQLSVFECTIEIADKIWVTAKLNVFQPDNLADYSENE